VFGKKNKKMFHRIFKKMKNMSDLVYLVNPVE